jgi:hypothetical protein
MYPGLDLHGGGKTLPLDERRCRTSLPNDLHEHVSLFLSLTLKQSEQDKTDKDFFLRNDNTDKEAREPDGTMLACASLLGDSTLPRHLICSSPYAVLYMNLFNIFMVIIQFFLDIRI